MSVRFELEFVKVEARRDASARNLFGVAGLFLQLFRFSLLFRME